MPDEPTPAPQPDPGDDQARPARPRRPRAAAKPAARPAGTGPASPAPVRRRRTAAAADQGGTVSARTPDPETAPLDPAAPGVPLDVNHELVPEGAVPGPGEPQESPVDPVAQEIGERLGSALGVVRQPEAASQPPATGEPPARESGAPEGAGAGEEDEDPTLPGPARPDNLERRTADLAAAYGVGGQAAGTRAAPALRPAGVSPALLVGGGVLLLLLLLLLGRRRG